ncbi:MAG: hypothetical protein G01um101433_895 [Parcubacteria group bacterium Gr01-1014_33]|nr:MAG: hypothetical protein G01um101433_895 [Parcubacteria group bacterium Gr01-1014_33]
MDLKVKVMGVSIQIIGVDARTFFRQFRSGFITTAPIMAVCACLSYVLAWIESFSRPGRIEEMHYAWIIIGILYLIALLCGSTASPHPRD